MSGSNKNLDYELILLLDPQLEEEEREKLAANAKAKLESAGELKGESNWGVRRMAFEINKHPEADYRCFRFDGGNDLLDDLDHSLKITDGVIRFRIYKVEADSPQITPPDTVQIMRRDDDERGPRRDGRGPRRPRQDDRSEERSGDAAEGEAAAPQPASADAG